MFNYSISIKRLMFISVTGLLLLISLVACSKDNPSENVNDSEISRLDWDRSADSILVRIDQIATTQSEAFIINTIPLCTVWGDGRLILLNDTEDTTEVLEARLTDDQVRQLIETMIGYGFYSWEDDIIPAGDENPTLESITLNLFDNAKTVERYDDWPNNGFVQILQACHDSSPTRAIVVPNGGWVSAYVLDSYDDEAITVSWPRNAPFTMEELVASDEPRWVEGSWAQEIWRITREIGPQQVSENGKIYEFAMEVPGISRTSQPAPVSEGQ